jgi:hypothetical protein
MLDREVSTFERWPDGLTTTAIRSLTFVELGVGAPEFDPTDDGEAFGAVLTAELAERRWSKRTSQPYDQYGDAPD